MAEPKTTLGGRLAKALSKVLRDNGVEDLASIYFHQEFEINQLPYVCVKVLDSRGDVHRNGNRILTVEVVAASSADKPEDESTADESRDVHQHLAQTLQELLDDSDLLSWINDAGEDLTAFLVTDSGEDTGNDGRMFWSSIRKEFTCAPSVIA